MKIEALECSYHITNLDSKLACNGIYNNALNFLDQSQQLITIHRQGKGLSPMGWVLADHDFNLIMQHIQPNSIVNSHAGQLSILPSINIVCQYHTDLTVPAVPFSHLKTLRNLLAILPRHLMTGLYGPLVEYQKTMALEEVHQLMDSFNQWLNGDAINWENHIGRGPGLTPSSDDMLTGMLFTAYACSKEKLETTIPFFENTPDLSLLTTSVSANYLHYASQGIFSSHLIKLANQLANNDVSLHTLFELLAVGHHSGVDTLLGIMLGYQSIGSITAYH